MGHADPKVNAIYLHISASHDRELSDALSEMAARNEQIRWVSHSPTRESNAPRTGPIDDRAGDPYPPDRATRRTAISNLKGFFSHLVPTEPVDAGEALAPSDLSPLTLRVRW